MHFLGDLIRNRSRLPRSLWWPKHRIPEDDDERKRIHMECSIIINRVFLSIVGYSLFCLITLSGSDVDILGVGEGEIVVPFTGVHMNVKSFLVVGPLILLALTTYMHIFIAEWSRLHNLVPIQKRTIKFFNLEGKIARLLTHVAFYWLCPGVVYFFYRKALPLPFPTPAILLIIFTSVSLVITLLSIRRSTGQNRLFWNAPKWVIIPLLMSWFVSTTSSEELPTRPMQLSDVQLAGKNLIGLNLKRAEMSGINLKNAIITDSELTKANLTRAQLAEANFSRTNLKEALLNDASAPDTDFSVAIMNHAQLRQANLSKSKFVEANLSDADLRSANMTEANLSRVKFNRADLRGVNLTKADLTNSSLVETRLKDANFTGATLVAASLISVDLSETEGITKDQLKLACVNAQTKLPKGLLLDPHEGTNCPPKRPTNLIIK